MPLIPFWLRDAAQSLATRLDLLRLTFDQLRAQLRDAISQQLGQTVSGAVREAVHALLDDGSGVRASPIRRQPYQPARNPMWEDDLEDERWRDRWEEDEPPPYRHEPVVVRDDEPANPNLNRAVLVGCEAASWWLRQRWGRLPVLAAFVIGGLSAAATYVGGPLGAAGVAVAGSLVSLLTLARTSQIDCEPSTEP